MSFDICRLFANNNTINKTIEVFAEYLFYHGLLKPPSFRDSVFDDMLEMSTTSASFSFDNNMYQQLM